ncbi:MAG: alkaline phosphatase family protein [Clostridia bacterium]|nr:alkaline phosphatase family protein [Clostridia bacterium]MCL6520843.1 alkaline phosphatase family protein [Bacillota bacterium]
MPAEALDEGWAPNLASLAASGDRRRLRPPFPSAASTLHATLVTSRPTRLHGIVADAFYDRELMRPIAWANSARLLQAPPLWSWETGGRPLRVTTLFWANSWGAEADAVVAPPLPSAPWASDSPPVGCSTQPAGLSEELGRAAGPLTSGDWWGPGAGLRAARWTLAALAYLLERRGADVLLAYLPQAGHTARRFGPGSPEARAAVLRLDGELGRLLAALEHRGTLAATAVLALSGRAIRPVTRPLPLNRFLREAGLLAVRRSGGQLYLDLGGSRAFAVCDQQVAHIYLQGARPAEVRGALEGLPGLAALLEEADLRALDADHPRSGDLVAIAEPDAWFPYDWWDRPEEAPPVARRVDPTGKPGVDPLELLAGPDGVPLDRSVLRGSFGSLAGRPEEGWLVSSRPLPALAQDEEVAAEEVGPILAAWLGLQPGLRLLRAAR